MNNRDYKVFRPENYYHVYNRGVGKIDIFRDDQDFRFFLSRLEENLFPGSLPDGAHQGIIRKAHTPYIRKSLPKDAFSLINYCLMPNHFHFLIRQDTDLPISKLLLKVCGGYSKYFNIKYDRVGSLFQDQFKAVWVDSDSYLVWLSAYIHQNPKVAGLVTNVEDYNWSSYPDYIGIRQGNLIDKTLIIGMFKDNPKAYKNFVEESLNKIQQRKDLSDLFLD